MNRKRYPSDLTDVQWKKLSPVSSDPSTISRPLKWEMCLIVIAIFYVVKSGCQWRMLPYDIPPWDADKTWLLIHQALHEQTRCDGGEAPSPTAAIIDGQSIKTTELSTTRGDANGI